MANESPSLIGSTPTSEQVQRLPEQMGITDIASAQLDIGRLWAAEFANAGEKDARTALANPAFYADSLRPDRSSALPEDLRGQWVELLHDAEGVASRADLRPRDARNWSHGVSGLTKLHDLIEGGELHPTERTKVADIISRASILFADSVVTTGSAGRDLYFEGNVRAMRSSLFQTLATREAQQQYS